MTYRTGSLDEVLAGFNHVVAKEAESEVVVRSVNAGESGNDSHAVEKVLKDLGAFHLNYEIKFLLSLIKLVY